MKVSVAAAALLFTAVQAAVDPIVIKGSKFFYKGNGTQFFMKGVAYQQELSSNTTESDDKKKYTDPLADADACKRDVVQLQKLHTNTIRVYAIDPTADHEKCMTMLANAGIYVIADLSEPGTSINRDDPGWDVPLYKRYTSVVDELMKYDNTLGFFAGNEVSNQKNNTAASAFVKAAVRDTKAYIKSKNYRPVGVGYATNDDKDIRENLADYFDCGKEEEAIDFWGYNIYSWCGDSSFQDSGFDVRTKEFQDYNVPVFFAEYGCNTPRPRLFTEVGALYGKEMNDVWSGGIVYMYFEEANEFGLATVDGDDVKTNKDFDNLSKQIAKANPTGVKMADYNPKNTAAATCPKVDAKEWGAPSDTLPPVVNADLCSCMMSSLSCGASSSVDDEDVGKLFGQVCGYEEGKYCAGINKNVTAGPYGAYSMCETKQQLSFAFNAYYEGKSKASDACNFKGAATTKVEKPDNKPASCKTLLDQAGKDGTGTVSAAPAKGSGSQGAAPGMSVSHVQVGSMTFGVYILGAIASGMAMIWL